MTYAIGIQSLAICDRCGQQYPYLSMQVEWTGFKVCDECFEPKHPQLEPITKPADPQALHNPRTDRVEPYNVYVGIPVVENESLGPVTGVGCVGWVTVVTS